MGAIDLGVLDIHSIEFKLPFVSKQDSEKVDLSKPATPNSDWQLKHTEEDKRRLKRQAEDRKKWVEQDRAESERHRKVASDWEEKRTPEEEAKDKAW